MITLADIRLGKDFSELEEIAYDDMRLLYHHDYKDGILSGMLKYKEQRYWFEWYKNEEEQKREFAILELTEEQFKEEDYWQKLYIEKIGTNTMYDENGELKSELKPRKMHDEFLGPYLDHINENPTDYSQNKVIAIFKNKYPDKPIKKGYVNIYLNPE